MAANRRTHVISIHSFDQWRAHLEASTKTDKLMVVEFKTSRCDYCKFIEPTVQEFAVKYERAATFIQINMDSASTSLMDLALQFEVRGYPTFIFIKKGKKVDKVVGTRKDELEQKIQKNANFSSEGTDATAGIITLHSFDEWRNHLKTSSNKLMVVEFKTSRCDYCKFIEPTVQEFAVKYERAATFIQINMDSASTSLLDLALQFEVRGYPTFIFIKKGQKVDKVVGTRKDELQQKIEKNANFSSEGTDATAGIITLHSLDEWKNHLKTYSNKLIVAGFLASWCSYCNMMEPSFEEFANTYRDVKFFKFDMSSPPCEFQEYAEQLQLQGYPTFILMKKERQVDMVVGPQKDDLKKKIEKYSRP